MLLAIWIAALAGLALWTLVAWGLNRLLLVDPTRVQDLKPLIGQIPHHDAIERWIPGWQTLLEFLIDLTQGMLSGLAHAAPWFAWAVWAIGVATILLIAGGLTLLVVIVRRESGRPTAPRLPG